MLLLSLATFVVAVVGRESHLEPGFAQPKSLRVSCLSSQNFAAVAAQICERFYSASLKMYYILYITYALYRLYILYDTEHPKP